MRRLLAIAAVTSLSLTFTACAGANPLSSGSSDGSSQVTPQLPFSGLEAFAVAEHGSFDEGWAMSFLPGTDHLLVSERGGSLQLRDQRTGEVTQVSGMPDVHHAGQAGMHDIILGPDFETDGTVYLSWVRDHDLGAQGVVGRGTLDPDTAALTDLDVIWEQTPTSGDGHFSLRMLIRDAHLFVTSGDRQKFGPAQEKETNLGAVVRLTLDGEPAPANPWAEEGGVAAELWTIGHRNPLGIAEDEEGNLWVSEMGPRGGDELNLLVEGQNYGWPEASMGVHYDGSPIPDHASGDGFQAPAEYWVPSISPGSLMIYRGELFEGWQGNAFIGGLSGERLVRVQIDGTRADAVEQWDMGERIRAVAEAPDGALWVLEDGNRGRLLELRPA
ncbi:PQQ-dependent sugar dehydrogenase [Corynebacterium comes]|uniref:Soluble aldose sugar dehydrogenase YliI n=1 Tax=Corynebacterium comes TaxID=2675218 RepID=A0A6B8W359_9CORY|nr:PQQ-dependent sugar dehydrogenase [Corynebacterium comes]QGU04200.1 Soluble aldose sugar dehydrogenase YliI precursor [Corynebacterium comes]